MTFRILGRLTTIILQTSAEADSGLLLLGLGRDWMLNHWPPTFNATKTGYCLIFQVMMFYVHGNIQYQTKVVYLRSGPSRI